MLEPISRVLEGWRVMMVPFIVAAGPPAEMMVLAMGKAEGLGVKACPATVYTLLGEGSESCGRSIVEFPMASTPEGSRLIIVPSTVIAESPAETTVPAIENAVGFGVKVWPATVKIVIEDGLIRETVLLPITKIPD